MDEGFAKPTVITTGNSEVSHTVNSEGVAKYFFRVRALNGTDQSPWSNVQSVEVRWEKEPNNTYLQAHENLGGPMFPGVSYYGYQKDEKDYFFFRTLTPGDITVALDDTVGDAVQLQLFRNAATVENRVAYDATPPFRVSYRGDAGTYYVFIYTAPGSPAPGRPYIVRALFP